MKKIKTIGIFDKEFPSNHSFVDDFFIKNNKSFNSKSYIICEGFPQARIARYHGVIILPKLHRRHGIHRYLNFFLIIRILQRLKRKNVNLKILIRNCPILLFGCAVLKSKRDRLVYQNSFPHENLSTTVKRFAVGKLLKASQSRVDGLLGISPLGLDRLQGLLPNVRESIYIPLCVSRQDIRQPKYENKEHNREFLKFCYIGTLDRLRAFDRVLSGFEIATKAGLQAELHVFGGKDGEITFLRSKAQTLSMSDRINFHGSVSRGWLTKELATFDVGVSLIPDISIYKEASPTKLVEYMGAGLPVIASFGCELQEKIVQESKAGILVTFDDISIAQGLMRLSRDNRLLTKMSKNATEYINSNYVYERYIDDFKIIMDLPEISE